MASRRVPLFTGLVCRLEYFCLFKKKPELTDKTMIGSKFAEARMDITIFQAHLAQHPFKGATLKNVSFRPTYALTNKYYRAVKTICFDGAIMDKLTYAALKGMDANLLMVTVV